MDFQPGDIQWIDNLAVLHTRTAYEELPGRKRHLYRIWLAVPDGRAVPEPFFSRHGRDPATGRPLGLRLPANVRPTAPARRDGGRGRLTVAYFASTPRIEPVTARGSRSGQRPASTWAKNSPQMRLNSSGSSMLKVCPQFTMTESAAEGMVCFISTPGRQAGPVLVAGQHQGRHPERRHLVREVVERGPPRLEAAHGGRRARLRMFGKLVAKLAPAARVLVLELHPGRAFRVDVGEGVHAVPLDQFRRRLGFGLELCALVGLRPVAAARHDKGDRALGIAEAEMQGGEPAFGEPAEYARGRCRPRP